MRLGQAEFCSCSISKPVIESVDLLTDLKALRSLAYHSNFSGKLVAGHRAMTQRSIRAMGCRVPVQFRRGNTGGSDPDQELSLSRLRLREISRKQRRLPS